MIRVVDRVSTLKPSLIREMSGKRRPTSIDFSLGQPALAPDAALVERANRALQGGPQGYTENPGLPELRALIAKHHALEGRAEAQNVLVTVGSQEAVFLAMTCTLEPGDEVLIPEPGYPSYRNIARVLGAVAVPYTIQPWSGRGATPEAIAVAITPRTRALILNTPSNPFGIVDREEDLARIAELIDRHDLVAISDEIYRDLYFGERPPASICTMTPRALFVSGLSKSCALTGHRLGYLIGEADFIRRATPPHQLMVACAPRLAQLIALEALKTPEILRTHVPYYEAARAALREAARALPPGARLFLGDGAFYAVLDISGIRGGDTLALALQLLEVEDVVVVPGVAFGPTGDWFWRLSYAGGADTARTGMERIARFLRSAAQAQT